MVKNPQNGHVRKILVQSASHRPVRKIDTALKYCPRIKIFRKFLSYGIKYFVLGHKFSENFCRTQIKFVLPHIGQSFRESF